MDFVEFCRKNQSDVTLSLPALTQANGVFSEGVLTPCHNQRHPV